MSARGVARLIPTAGTFVCVGHRAARPFPLAMDRPRRKVVVERAASLEAAWAAEEAARRGADGDVSTESEGGAAAGDFKPKDDDDEDDEDASDDSDTA